MVLNLKNKVINLIVINAEGTLIGEGAFVTLNQLCGQCDGGNDEQIQKGLPGC